jgi:DNA modification methylase
MTSPRKGRGLPNLAQRHFSPPDKMHRMKLHPACTIFPKLNDDELRELAEDIKANGLQNPIVLFDGKILDGRNRFAACKLAGVKPRFVKWEGTGSPVAWVISQNLVRRHLTASQRAIVALDILPMLEKEAKERQRLSNGRGKKVAHPGANLNGKASEIAARITKASSRYIETAKAIGTKAPELLDRIRTGELGLSDAKWVAELPAKDRTSLLAEANGHGLDDDIIRQWRSKQKPKKPVQRRMDADARLAATTLIYGDCRDKLKEIASKSVDAIITDPIYPEIDRDYGRISEAEWHDLMHDVVLQAKRILKPTGSAVFILQPNYQKVGKMRLWLWEFLLWAAKEWNLIQDVYWWATDTLPASGTNRHQGLMRQSVKTCIWLGTSDCYRNQDAVLWEPCDRHSARKWQDRALRHRPSGHSVRDGRTAQTSALRGGSVPFNLLPFANSNTSGTGDHPASTPYDLAAWWCKYILPSKGVLLDCFCGSAGILTAGLDHGASKVIGIEKEKKYLVTARKRLVNSV